MCKKCGNELAEGAAFCGKCGNSINMNSALQTLSPQCNKNTSNNWFANIDEKTIEKQAYLKFQTTTLLLNCEISITCICSFF